MNLDDTSTIRHRHFKLVTFNFNGFPTRRQVAERLHNQAADGIDFLIAEMGAEGIVEVFDIGQCAHGIHMAAKLANIHIFFIVIFVFDLADDQFQNIFDGDQAGNAAKLVNDDSHVITLGTKFFQHPVNALAFRHHHCGTQHFINAERFGVGAHEGQQVLGHQNAFNVILVFADHRKA